MKRAIKVVHGKIGLKGWILNALEDNDILAPMEEALKEVAREAAGEALSILLEQEDCLAFLAIRDGGKTLKSQVVVPLSSADDLGETTLEIDITRQIRDLIEFTDDDDLGELRRIRDMLQSLTDECSARLG